MIPGDGPDAPSAADTLRMRTAHSNARRALATAEARYDLSSTEAFRKEIGATVRSASPFLIALLANEGLVLDDVVEAIEPGYAWPRRPRFSSRRKGVLASEHAFRHIAAGLLPDPWPDRHSMHGTSVYLPDYTSAKVHIDAHSIEVWVRLKTATFSTRFGLLRIDIGRPLPETVAIACVDRRVEDVVDHSSLHGTGWRVVAVEAYKRGSVLVVQTGSIPYRLPWAR